MTTARTWSTWLWAAAPVLLIYLAHLWFGANSSFAALTLAALEGLFLLVFLCRPSFRTVLARAPALWWIGALLPLSLLPRSCP
jgi:hypothetical protein